MGNERMQAAIKELQGAMIVMAHIEKKQSEHINELIDFRLRTEPTWPKSLTSSMA